MLNYRIIRQFGIVKLYFEFMFKGEGGSTRIEHTSRFATVHACMRTVALLFFRRSRKPSTLTVNSYLNPTQKCPVHEDDSER